MKKINVKFTKEKNLLVFFADFKKKRFKIVRVEFV